MDKLGFYKEFYMKEFTVKYELNNAVNVPIIVLTGIIALHVYVFGQNMQEFIKNILAVISTLNLIAILLCIWFLCKSFMNLGKAHTYAEIDGMVKYEQYFKKLDATERDTKFEEALVMGLAHTSSHNFEINKIRTVDMANAKKALFASIVLSVIFSIVYIYSLINTTPPI